MRSSTGAPFAAEGSPTWPRNLGLVFSQYDEFSKIMWNVDRAKDVTSSEKLKAVFGTTQTIVPGQIYGQIANGTARRLSTPATTHPPTEAPTSLAPISLRNTCTRARPLWGYDYASFLD